MSLNKNIQVIYSSSTEEVTKSSYTYLENILNTNTTLFLSGGNSPKQLYNLISNSNKKLFKNSALIDERFGNKYHINSNEKMIKDSNLLSYMEKYNIQFFPILEGKKFNTTIDDYNKRITNLIESKSQKVAIMGIGEDGHTAGILPNLNIDMPLYVYGYESHDLYKERITLTFKSLQRVDIFIIITFGETKARIVEKVLSSNNLNKFPASFYNTISSKVYIFTDTHIKL